MAIVYAVKSGNWSDTTVWNTGALPTSADDVRSNTYTVTIDGSYTVKTLSCRAETSPVVALGGTFLLTNGITFTASGGIFLSGNGSNLIVITSTLAAGETATVVGAVTGGNSNTGFSDGIRVTSGGGTINVIGNITGGGNGDSLGIRVSSSATVNVIGNVTGGGNIYADGIKNSSNGTVNVTGNCTGGTYNQAHGINNTSNGNFNITGNCYGPVSGGGTSEANWAAGACNSSVGNLNITGNIYGTSTANLGPGAMNLSTGIMTVIGSVNATAFGVGIGRGIATSVTLLTGPFICASNSVQAVAVPAWRWKAGSSGTYMDIRTNDLTAVRKLYTADYTTQLMMPAITNVRKNTVYGPVNELTGSMNVPSAASVYYGVPVDNTTGTVTVTAQGIAQAIWNYTATNLTVAGSVGERVKNAATVESVAEQIVSII